MPVSLHRGVLTLSTALRGIVLFSLVLLFLALVFSAFFQYRLFRQNLDDNLEVTLTIEGRILANWLSETLSPLQDFVPFNSGWDPKSDPTLLEYTGASWLLLRSNGEVAVFPSGQPMYAYPAEATSEIDWSGDLALIAQAARGEEAATDLLIQSDRIVKRIYLPVQEVSGIFTEPWVLVGQAGEGTFSELVARQQNLWLSAAVIGLASMVLMILLIRGILTTSRLERSLREAEESVEIETLTSTLAHELRNPLMIVQSSAEILRRDEPLSEEGKGLVADLLEELHRTQDVLASHLHPERDLDGEIRDLLAYVNDYWDQRKTLLETRSMVLDTSYPANRAPLAVRACETRLEQILDNLLRNSMEALPSGGGRLWFSIEEGTRCAILRFRDDGPGLSANSSIWKDGWRAGGGKSEGKGIGLRLTKKWIERWGGKLEARSVRASWFGKPHGAEVVLTLMRVDEGESEPHPPGPLPRGAEKGE